MRLINKMLIKYFHRFINFSPFKLSLSINLFFLITHLLFGHIKYEVSDDFIMQLLVSGGYTGTPSPEIVFMNILIGYFLSFLYTYLPHINWFFWMHIFVIFISCFSICYIILKIKNTAIIKFLIVVFLCFFSPDLYLLIQFTKTSTVALLASAMFFLYWLIYSTQLHYLIFASMMSFIGLAIRDKCINIILPYFILIVFFYLIINRNIITKKKILNILIIFSISFGNLTLLNIINRYYEDNHANYKSYIQYNSIRASVLDYPYYDYSKLQEPLQEIGINENDYLNLTHWNFIDTDFFDYEKLNNIYDVLNDYRDEHPLGIKASILQLMNQNYYKYVSVMGCLSIFFIGILICKKYFVYSSIAILGTGIVLFLYAYIGRLMYRVEYSTFLALSIYLIVLQLFLNQRKFNFKKTLIIACCFLILGRTPLYIGETSYAYHNLFFSMINVVGKYRSQFNQENRHNNLIKEFKNNPNNLYLLGFQTMTQTYYLNYSPFTSGCFLDFQNTIYISGVETNHPEWKEALMKWKIKNPALGLLEKNVYLVENVDQENIFQYLKIHFTDEVKIVLYKELDGFKIWKFYI